MSAPALIAREGTSWESRGGNGEVVRLFGLWASCSALLAGAIGAGTVLAAGPVDARVGGEAALSVQPADPREQGDGTMSAAAGAAIEQGPLPASADDVAAKAAANAASDAAARAGSTRQSTARPVQGRARNDNESSECVIALVQGGYR
jgi:hypothetical protein